MIGDSLRRWWISGRLCVMVFGGLSLVLGAASCPPVTRDAKVGTVYIGQEVDVTKKLGDADGQIYNQFQNIPGAVAAPDQEMPIYSVVDWHGITYAATKLTARDPLGGANIDRVQVWILSLAGEDAQLVFEEVAGLSTRPALVVGNNSLYVAWVGGYGFKELHVFRNSSDRFWNNLGSITLSERLDGIDTGFFNNRLLIAGTSGGSIHVYEVRPQPLQALDRHRIGTGTPYAENVSIATGSEWAAITYARRGPGDLLPSGDLCNSEMECRTLVCTNGICAGSLASEQTPGFVYVSKLGLSGDSRGVSRQLYRSPRIENLKWLSATRIVEASDDPPPNDYFVLAFRGRMNNKEEIFYCKWTWPQGAYSSISLSPSACPAFLELNDQNLQIFKHTFDVYADEFYRRRRR